MPPTLFPDAKVRTTCYGFTGCKALATSSKRLQALKNAATLSYLTLSLALIKAYPEFHIYGKDDKPEPAASGDRDGRVTTREWRCFRYRDQTFTRKRQFLFDEFCLEKVKTRPDSRNKVDACSKTIKYGGVGKPWRKKTPLFRPQQQKDRR
jgi:hypothetical protein